MYAKLTLSAIALLMACKMNAVQLTPQEALARMNTANLHAKGFATDQSSLQLTYTSTFNGSNTYYVFNKGNEQGYLILSADDCMPAVLGVVEGNSFDYDKLPDNMKWWLSQYDVSISNYSAKGRKYASSSTKKKDIEPLLGDIEWSQWAPYNMLCPTIEGKETPTGCVATAMAQVMGMYQWPKRGYGSNEYNLYVSKGEPDENGVGQSEKETMARDFTQSKYKWEKILPQYDGYESEEENLAIAQLMYDCGISINMEYKSSGSASDLPEVVNALVKNFSYDKNIRIEYRKFYDDDVWENMLYENLSKGMPLVFSGQDGKTFFEGHAFVCDGYMVDGNLFHFNWGWGGYDDGYFFLSGNGNGDGDDDDEGWDEECLYNKAQNAIFNIKPSKTPYVEGSEGEFPLLVYKSCKFYVDDKTTDVIPRSIKSNAYGWDFDLVYSGYVAHEYSIGYKFKNESNEYIIPFRYQEGELLPFADVYMNFGFDYENILKNGKYTVSYVYKDITAGNTEWKDAIYQPGATKPVVEVTGLEPCCSLVGEPEVLYNGKNVIDDTEIHRVPGVNEITIKFKVKALKALKNNEIIINLKGSEHDVTKTLKLSKAAANSVQDVEAKMSLKEFKSNDYFYLYLLQSKDDEYIYLPDSRKYLSWQFHIYGDNSTGIEIITQTGEKAASETIYDIYGRKVSNMNRGGLYIKNGKNFIAK